MFWLRDLRFVLCSRDLDELSVQRIIGFLSYLPTNQRGQNIEFQTVYPIFLKELYPKNEYFKVNLKGMRKRFSNVFFACCAS